VRLFFNFCFSCVPFALFLYVCMQKKVKVGIYINRSDKIFMEEQRNGDIIYKYKFSNIYYKVIIMLNRSLSEYFCQIKLLFSLWRTRNFGGYICKRVITLMSLWDTIFILTRRRADNVPLRSTNISVFRLGIKLGVTPNDIPKVNFATTLNQVLTYTRTSPRRWPKYFFTIAWRSTGIGRKWF
jgi:hypothetical protein